MENEPISIRSGTWTWQVTGPGHHTGPHTSGTQPAGMADPDPKADSGDVVLLLQDPERPDDWMIRELPGDTDPAGLEPGRVEFLARHPDLRQVTGPGGETWSIQRVPAPRSIRPDDANVDRAPLRVQASQGGGPPHLLELPDGLTLGEMRREDLLTLLEDAGEEGS